MKNPKRAGKEIVGHDDPVNKCNQSRKPRNVYVFGRMYPKSLQQTRASKNHKIKSFFSSLKLFFFSLKHNVARGHLKQGILRTDDQCDYNHDDRFQKATASVGTNLLFLKTCIHFKHLTLAKELLPFINNLFCMLKAMDA